VTAQLVCERRIDPPAGSEKPGPFVPNAVNVLEGFGSPEVGLDVDFEVWWEVCQCPFDAGHRAVLITDSLQPLPQLWLAQPSDGFQVVCLREKVEQIQRHHFVA